MADFVAVIRRAVDGLSDNTPEMRAKVYDKARTAVQRQLDNMNPRPAEDMIARQMDKLSEAIRSVESDFSSEAAEAPEETPQLAENAEALESAEEEAPPAPSEVEEEESEQADAETAPESEEEEPAQEDVETEAPESESEASAEEEAVEEPETVEAEEDAEEAPSDETSPQGATEEPAWATEYKSETPEDTAETVEETEAEDLTAEEEPAYSEAAPEESAEAEVSEPEEAAPEPEVHAESWTATPGDNPFDEPEDIFGPAPVSPAAEEEVRETMPPIGDYHGDLDHPAETETPEDSDRGQLPDWLSPSHASEQEAPATEPQDDKSDEDRWDAFEKSIGLGRPEEVMSSSNEAETPEDAGRTDDQADFLAASDEGILPPPPLFEDNGGGSGKLIVALVAALLVLAAAGYAGWRYSDAILNMLGGSTPAEQTTTTAPAASEQPKNTADTSKETTTPAKTEDQGPQKFTQRLLPDGSEVDPGPAGGAATNAEKGKSVAGQNEKPAEAAKPSGDSAKPATQTADANAPKAEKMLLYEERLGQTSPVAVDGTVKWSIKTIKTDSGSKQKAIEGDIQVPGRKMSAMMTIKRNTDASLPASHIIELTFSLPKDFEGGGIESVTRIAMKNNEQDQGNPLIAVPAKITDYFHMIALNAYPDAVKTNMELLKNRDWIDIPIIYSNGRHALITLQKGAEGKTVFDEVIASWEASGSNSGSNSGTSQ